MAFPAYCNSRYDSLSSAADGRNRLGGNISSHFVDGLIGEVLFLQSARCTECQKQNQKQAKEKATHSAYLAEALFREMRELRPSFLR